MTRVAGLVTSSLFNTKNGLLSGNRWHFICYIRKHNSWFFKVYFWTKTKKPYSVLWHSVNIISYMLVELLFIGVTQRLYNHFDARKRSPIKIGIWFDGFLSRWFFFKFWISSYLTKIIPISIFPEKNVYDQVISWFHYKHYATLICYYYGIVYSNGWHLFV